MDLPPDLALPLITGEPWWYWLGGRPSVDFVNTRRERWARKVETLVTPEDLSRWLVRAGVLDQLPGSVTPGLLEQARELREAVDRALSAAVEDRAPSAATLRAIDRWLTYAGDRPELTLGAGGVPVLGVRAATDTPRRALATLALDAATMLGTPAERARVRICGSDTCSARFYDRSPAGRRRWCSMEGCGNQAKARRHRARRRVEAGT